MVSCWYIRGVPIHDDIIMSYSRSLSHLKLEFYCSKSNSNISCLNASKTLTQDNNISVNMDILDYFFLNNYHFSAVVKPFSFNQLFSAIFTFKRK